MGVQYTPMSMPGVTSIRKNMLVRIDDEIQDDSILEPTQDEDTQPVSDDNTNLLANVPADPTGEDIVKASLQEANYNPAFGHASPIAAIHHDITDLSRDTDEDSLLGDDPDKPLDIIDPHVSTPNEIPAAVLDITESQKIYASDYPDYFTEAAMKAKVRNQLPDSEFGIPRLRKYPLNDEKHVRMAVSMFGHCKDPKDKELLAKKIFAKIEEFGIDITIGKNSALYDYAPKSLQEAVIVPMLDESELQVYGMEKPLDKRTKEEVAREHLERNSVFYNTLFYGEDFTRAVKALSTYSFLDYFYPSFKTHNFYSRIRTALSGIAVDKNLYAQFGMRYPLDTDFTNRDNWINIKDEDQFVMDIQTNSDIHASWFHADTTDDMDHVKYCMALYSILGEMMINPNFQMDSLSANHLGVLTDWTQMVVYNWDLMNAETPMTPRYLYYAQKLHDLFWDCIDNPFDSGIASSNMLSMVKNMPSAQHMISNMNEAATTPEKLRYNLVHLSETNKDGVTLEPRIPDNFMTKNGYEDATIARVCFADTIGHALRAMSMNLKDKVLYVHVVVDNQLQIKKPTTKQVPDSKLTGEYWSLFAVQLRCIGKIKVSESTGDGLSYRYGDNTAELYDWNWSWVEKYKGFKHLSEATELISKVDCAGYMVHELGFEDDLFLLPDTLEYPIFNASSVRLAMDMITRIPASDVKQYSENLNRKYKELGCTFSISVDHPYAKYADQNIIDHMNRVLVEGDTAVSDQGTSTTSLSMDTEPWYKRLDVNGNVGQNLLDNKDLGPNDKKYPNPDFTRHQSVF